MSVRRISFEITNACNLDCPHCLRDNKSSKRYLPVEYVEKVCRQAKRYGTEIIILTGGEPFLHPHIEKMIETIVDHGYLWYTVSNGTLTDRIAKLIGNPKLRAKMTHLSVSLDGSTEEKNDFIRGPGHFRKVMKTLSLAKAKGFRMGFKTAINTANVSDMEAIVNLASRLGAAFVEFSHMVPTHDLITHNLILPRSQWAEADKEFARLRGIYRLELNMCTGSRCALTFAQCFALSMNDLHFDFDGNLSACCMLPNFRGSDDSDEKDIVGNIGESDLWDLHSRLIGLLAGINQAKIRKIKNDSMTESDYYPCVFCLKHLGKLEWLKKEFPDNEWVAEDIKK